MIYLHKVIPLITSPLFVVIILILWGIYFSSKRACFLAISILVVCSLPVFSNKLISNLEKDKKISKDFERDYTIEIQDLTDEYINTSEEIVIKKIEEISEV